MTTPIELRAGDASAVVDQARGGMLTSLAWAGRELLAPEPAVDDDRFPLWGSFLMAPWVGHLSAGRLPFRGRVHTITPNWGPHAVHGLVARAPWTIDRRDGRSLELSRPLEPPWPFGGRVRQRFDLEPDGLTQTAAVEAELAAMPAALGWHPWFRRPDRGDLRVSIMADRLLEHDGELPTGGLVQVAGDMDLRETPALGERRIDVVYVGAASPARILADDVELTIAVDPRITTLVVYTPPEAVCVEPWSAWPDAHRLAADGHSTGLVELQPGERLERWTRWTWAQAAGQS